MTRTQPETTTPDSAAETKSGPRPPLVIAPTTALPQDAEVRKSVDLLGSNLRYIGAGMFGSAVVQYLLFFGMARVLGVQQYGAFSLALTIGILATPLCNLGINVGLVHACSRDPSRLPAYLGAGLFWRAALAVPVFAAAYGVCQLLGYGAEVLWLLLPLFVASLADGVGMLASSVFQAWERMSYSAGIAMLRSVLRCAALGLVLLTGGDARELALYYALAAAAAALPPWLLIARRVQIDWHPRHWWPVLRQSNSFAIGVLALLALGQIDVALVGWLTDIETVGAYHAATRFLVLALLVPQIVTTAVSPLAYKLGLHGPGAVSRLYHFDATAVGALGMGAALLLALHGGDLVALALGNDYAASAPVAHALAPLVFLRFIAIPLDNAMRASGRQATWGLASLLAVGATVGLGVLLVPPLGALGAVLACVLAQLGYVLLQAFVLHHEEVDLAWGRVFGRWTWITAAVAAAVWGVDLGWLPGWVHAGLLPAAGCAFAVGAWCWPTSAERGLRRRLLRR